MNQSVDLKLEPSQDLFLLLPSLFCLLRTSAPAASSVCAQLSLAGQRCLEIAKCGIVTTKVSRLNRTPVSRQDAQTQIWRSKSRRLAGATRVNNNFTTYSSNISEEPDHRGERHNNEASQTTRHGEKKAASLQLFFIRISRATPSWTSCSEHSQLLFNVMSVPVKMSPGLTPLGSLSWLGSPKKYAVECPLSRM